MPAIAIPIAITSDLQGVDSSFNRACHRVALSSTPLPIFTLPYSVSVRASVAMPNVTIAPMYRSAIAETRWTEMGQGNGGLSLKLNGNMTGETQHSNREMSGKNVDLPILYGRFHPPVTCRSGGKG